MREIKFRAWDEGKAIYPNLVGRYGDHFTVWCPDGGHTDTHELEQFTGLHDKNGKEIYEGDLLRLISGEKISVRTVSFDGGRFCLDILGDEYWNEYTDRLEVIGNIHENPELLEASC